MASDHHMNHDPDMVHRDTVGSAVRWTLGNLDQAFDQAFDEAFRTCTHLLNELERRAGTDEVEGRDGGRDDRHVESQRPIVARFRTCEGPIADGGQEESDQPEAIRIRAQP